MPGISNVENKIGGGNTFLGFDLVMWAFFFCVSLFGAIALYVLSPRLAKSTAMRTLRDRTSLFIDMYQGPICSNPNQ
jgi:hypothetical protein